MCFVPMHLRLITLCLSSLPGSFCLTFFFFTDTAPTEIYTLSLHDALPISMRIQNDAAATAIVLGYADGLERLPDRKSTRLNSSHRCISYAVFCLKKKKAPLGPQRGTAA